MLFPVSSFGLDVPGTEFGIGVLAGATVEELAAKPEASPTVFIHP